MEKIITILGHKMLNANYNCSSKNCKEKMYKCDCGSCKTTEKKKRRIWVRPYNADPNSSGVEHSKHCLVHCLIRILAYFTITCGCLHRYLKSFF